MRLVGLKPIVEAGGDLAIAIAGASATVYSECVDLKAGEYFALSYKATSDGNVKLTISVEQSFRKPTTEGASDVAWVVPENVSALHTDLADENWHHIALTPITMQYARLKIVSGSGNDNSTTLQGYWNIQEQC